MRLHIEGHNIKIAAYVLGWIAERLGDLNAVHNDIVSALVMLTQQQRRTEALIELVLAGKTLRMSQCGKTQSEAVHAALQIIERQLAEFRMQQHMYKTSFARMRGRIIELFPERSAGVIRTDAHKKVYFHAQTVQGIAFAHLQVDMVVALDMQSGSDSPQATRVMPYWM